MIEEEITKTSFFFYFTIFKYRRKRPTSSCSSNQDDTKISEEHKREIKVRSHAEEIMLIVAYSSNVD